MGANLPTEEAIVIMIIGYSRRYYWFYGWYISQRRNEKGPD